MREREEEIGLFPSWSEWRASVEERLRLDWKNFNGAESVLEEAYKIRRLLQMGADPTLWHDFIKQTDREYPGLLDKHQAIVELMVRETVSEEVKDLADRYAARGPYKKKTGK